MKKFFVFLTAFFAMAYYMTLPLLVKADTVEPVIYSFEVPDTSPLNTYTNLFHDYTVNEQHPFYAMNYVQKKNNYYFLHTFQVDLNDKNYEVNFSQNVFSVQCADTFTVSFKSKRYYNNTLYNSLMTFSGSITLMTFDFNTNTFKMYNGLNEVTPSDISNNGFSGDDFYFYEIKENLTELSFASELNLSISFQPATSGIISRTQTINGKQYTSDTLDMIVSNYGDDAQFAWFILPHNGSISFPGVISTDNQGFFGSPVFAYVTDEWIQLDSKVYSPCVWHTIPENYTSQYYSVPWGSMKLSENTQYDCVVYAKNIEHTDNIASPTWSTSAYTVQSDLSDVVEVYRSSFTITDPAEYKSQNEGFGVHPWNPDIDNSGLFSSSSAFVDDNGNVVIKGAGSGSDIANAAWGNGNSLKSPVTTSAYNNIFGFVKYCLESLFPGEIPYIFYFALTAIVLFGIIKVVFK